MTTEKRLISLSVNGELQAKIIEPRMSLADFLRIELELTGTHVGCESGVCGACTVNINGQTARACTMLAVQVEGDEVTTIEEARRLHRSLEEKKVGKWDRKQDQECEDADGNVYNKKTYEDLKRQGLI